MLFNKNCYQRKSYLNATYTCNCNYIKYEIIIFFVKYIFNLIVFTTIKFDII